MSQSSAIAFFLLAAFLIFITQRGSLPVYMGFVLGSATPAPNAPATPAAAPQQTSDAGQTIGTALQVAAFL